MELDNNELSCIRSNRISILGREPDRAAQRKAACSDVTAALFRDAVASCRAWPGWFRSKSQVGIRGHTVSKEQSRPHKGDTLSIRDTMPGFDFLGSSLTPHLPIIAEPRIVFVTVQRWVACWQRRCHAQHF